ncbi:hypothetical protein ACFVGM_09100 [Kitasatospora purpeofusca]|uniref:hypothetical protein n=1 Tax=Kitasatospora purpeofusca TaxID=67352 RepID=UPI00368DE77E
MNDSPDAWIDAVPDLEAFLAALEGFAQKSVDGMRCWAQIQWAHRGDARAKALSLVEFAEESAEGRALVSAWRAGRD